MDDKEQTVQDQLVHQIMVGEVQVAEQNSSDDNSDFESYVDLFDSIRTAKEYDWMSDISIPEFASHMLTQSSMDVAQYFQTRDFCEVYLEDEGEQAKAHADATKELINRTLNQRELYHYLKFIRAKNINQLAGKVYLKCWWEQELEEAIVGEETKFEELDVDDYGNPLVSPEQQPAKRYYDEPVIGEVPVIDRFNYDVYDQRNVFTSNEYVYSLQDKQWVIFRDEATLSELKELADNNGYFNLDKLEDGPQPKGNTEAADATYNKNKNSQPPTSSVEKKFDVYERYGTFWTKVDRDKETDRVLAESAKPGLDEFGKPLEDAELFEVIITIAKSKGTSTLIGYKITPFIDADGFPYKPLIRGLCYVHPTEDGGAGDGQYTRELQIAIDDTFNISQDRTMLATLPTLKGKKYSLDDNSTVYFQPGHTMELEDPSDVEEFKISDNISAALQQISVLQAKMQQVDAVQPPSMGGTPDDSSTTATAVATATQGQSIRTNYKSLTFENTALVDLYWMIQQMTYTFARPETGMKLMGEKVYDFDPTKNYYYKPLSQSIETDQSKAMKRKEWYNLGTIVAQVQHPETVKMLNYIFGEYVKLMGDEYVNFKDKFLDEKVPIQQGGEGGMSAAGGADTMTPSNQNGVAMTTPEIGTREASYLM